MLVGLGASRPCRHEIDTFGQARVGSSVHQAASAGAHARVRNVAVRLRNQQQQTAIYISSGAPCISDCDIQVQSHSK